MNSCVMWHIKWLCDSCLVPLYRSRSSTGRSEWSRRTAMAPSTSTRVDPSSSCPNCPKATPPGWESESRSSFSLKHTHWFYTLWWLFQFGVHDFYTWSGKPFNIRGTLRGSPKRRALLLLLLFFSFLVFSCTRQNNAPMMHGTVRSSIWFYCIFDLLL